MTGPRLAALVIAAVALAVVATAMTFPSGSGGVPGPAVVPLALGVGLLAVASTLLRTPGQGAPRMVRHHAAVPLTVVCLLAYASFWRVVPFGVLTGMVLLTYFRITGVRWRNAVIASVSMAAALSLLFERGLGVRF